MAAEVEEFIGRNSEFFITDDINVVHVMKIDDNTFQIEFGLLGKRYTISISREELIAAISKREPKIEKDTIHIGYVFSMV